jgi:hypothetical protein
MGLTFDPQPPQSMVDDIRSAHFPEQQAGIVPVHCEDMLYLSFLP